MPRRTNNGTILEQQTTISISHGIKNQLVDWINTIPDRSSFNSWDDFFLYIIRERFGKPLAQNSYNV
jgi:hypothetical protein